MTVSSLLVSTGLLLAASAHAEAPATPVAPADASSVVRAEENETVPAGLLQLPNASNFYSPYAFVVDKQARMLSVWQQTSGGLKKISSFPADMGKSSGEKKSSGDHKTPEGIYFLLERLESGPGSIDPNTYGKRAFVTDYPNFFDRNEGKTGYGIWLHAVPDTVALTRGSRGCVVVRNEVILGLSQYVKVGRTPILIQDHPEMVPAKEAGKVSGEISQWLESWRNAWESKDLATYIDHYGKEFRSNHMNRDQWRRYKDRLAKSYKSINVKLSKPAIFIDRNRAIVRFLQEYSSKLHTDIGEKVLYLKKGDTGAYQIVGETWSEETNHLAHDEIEAAHGTTTTVSSGCAGGSDCQRTSAIRD